MSNLNIVDLLSRTHNDQILAVGETLAQTNQIIQDMPMVECNDGTGFKSVIRTGYPATGWRKLNYGVKQSKSEINLRPGAVLWQSQSVTDGLKPLFQAQMDLGKAELLVSKVKQTLKSQFFVDVMATMLSDPKTNQTATEVAEKVQERLAIMGPVLERLVEECHKPLIELADAYNAEQGLYDDLIPPESLQGEELKITFNSIFHEAQKASGTRSMDMLVGSFGQYAQIKPEILDLLDTDKLGRLVAEKLSLTEMMLDEDKVSAVRQERAQAQQTAAEMEQAQSAADISQKLAAADKQTAGLDFRGGY